MTNDDHEAAVAAFLKQCELERPAETAEVYARHKVVPESTMVKRRLREVSLETGSVRVGRGRYLPVSDVLADEPEREEREEDMKPLEPFTAEDRKTDVERLRDFLTDGPKPAAEVATLMPDYSLRKAKAELGVKARRIGFGRDSVVMWELAHTR